MEIDPADHESDVIFYPSQQKLHDTGYGRPIFQGFLILLTSPTRDFTYTGVFWGADHESDVIFYASQQKLRDTGYGRPIFQVFWCY